MAKERRKISEEGRGPLVGVRILDFTRVAAGPYGSLTLADLGAEVILIEAPAGAVSLSTRDAPDTVHTYKGESIQFTALNRNKKSICLDLRSQKGKEVFYDLVRKSDVVFDNFRPGVMGRLGINYETSMFAVFAGKLTDMDFRAILEVREKLQEDRTHVHTHYSTGECFAPLR